MARWRLWWRAIRGFSRPKRVGDRQVVWMSHGDEVAKLPQGFRVMAQSQQGVVAAREWRFYGLQYHPEVLNINWFQKQPNGNDEKNQPCFTFLSTRL
ncbi:GMP synthase [glutamine-hydrolyzing] isoform X2 [Rosa chinensis]|uniref:GMP synthase [glutamine-hydrolyzing] isoform X2 n=1 Tax=Rosa chinensis TaxID=74649 RepID=UPI001AD8E86C|nr:GMP synthase [glutamine-hydrolyzing] isoform X2 [Rosa chinensis]